MMQATRITNASTLTMGSVGVCEFFIPNSVYTQSVRWKRKPIWLPTAKSKVFRVPTRPVVSIEEAEELKRLHNNYKTYMTSLNSYIRETTSKNKIQSKESLLKQLEEKDFLACNAVNDEWNAEIAKEREIRLMKQQEVQRENILYKLVKKEEAEERRIMEIDEEIRKVKNEAVTFITEENIDEAIEECLSNIINHNRAVDLDGNWYEGKYSKIPILGETNSQTVVDQQAG